MIRFIFAACCLASSLRAETLAWDDAVAEAKRANPDLLVAEENLRQAETAELSAQAQFLPKAGLNASATQGGTYDPQSDSLSGGPPGDTHYGLNLDASLNLFRGFSNVASLRQAGARLRQAKAARTEARASVLYSLRASFAQLIYGAQLIALSDNLASRATENRDMVQLRFEAGAENKGSYLQAKALASQAAYDAVRAKRQLRQASLQLSRLLGRAPDAGLRAKGALMSPEGLQEPDFAALVEKATAVLKAKARLDEAEAARLGAYSPFLPSLNASASLNRTDIAWAPQRGSWSAGLSLDFPIFNGFSDSLALDQAGSGEASARAAATEARLQARLDLESAWQNLLDAVAGVQLQAEELEASLARAEIGRAQYAQGLMNFENWDRIESDLSSARKAGLSGQLNAVITKAAWDKAQGKEFEP
jgi:outer membrane protein TolC